MVPEVFPSVTLTYSSKIESLKLSDDRFSSIRFHKYEFQVIHIGSLGLEWEFPNISAIKRHPVTNPFFKKQKKMVLANFLSFYLWKVRLKTFCLVKDSWNCLSFKTGFCLAWYMRKKLKLCLIGDLNFNWLQWRHTECSENSAFEQVERRDCSMLFYDLSL